MIKVKVNEKGVNVEVEGTTKLLLKELVQINLAVLRTLSEKSIPIAIGKEVVCRALNELIDDDIKADFVAIDLDAIKKMRGDAHESD